MRGWGGFEEGEGWDGGGVFGAPAAEGWTGDFEVDAGGGDVEEDADLGGGDGGVTVAVDGGEGGLFFGPGVGRGVVEGDEVFGGGGGDGGGVSVEEDVHEGFGGEGFIAVVGGEDLTA